MWSGSSIPGRHRPSCTVGNVALQPIDVELDRILRDVDFVAREVGQFVASESPQLPVPVTASRAERIRGLLDLRPDEPARNQVEMRLSRVASSSSSS